MTTSLPDTARPVAHGRRRARGDGRTGGRGFRTEIQAARAIAIASVVAYHYMPGWLPGGFVGVDIFFAISGFLITSHIVTPLLEGSFTFRGFYSRRIWRLLPAALLVLAAVTLATWLFVPSTMWSQFGRQLAGSAFYVENWVLAANAVDYSALDPNSSPVQHFWSLSAEEQFYAAWPLILTAAVLLAAWVRRRRGRGDGRRNIAVALGVVFAASLAYSIIQTTRSTDAYFITTTRAWEFAAGGLLWLALERVRVGPRAQTALGWAGIAVLAGTLLFFNGSTPFPSWTALIPIVGVGAIIAGGAPRVGWAATRLYGLPPVQWLGDISYSLYLWHWPLLVLVPYAIHVTETTIPKPVKLGMLIAALALAWVTRAFVEKPLIAWSSERRRSGRMRFPVVAVGTAVAMLVVAVPAGSLAWSVRPQPITQLAAPVLAPAAASPAASGPSGATRTPTAAPSSCIGAAAMLPGASCPAVAANRIVPQPTQAESDDFGGALLDPGCQLGKSGTAAHECVFGDAASTTSVALVGDSHAAEWEPALELLANEHHWRLVTLVKSSCTLNAANTSGACGAWNRAVLQKLEAEHVDVVVAAGISAQQYAPQSAGESSLEAGAAGFAADWRKLEAAGTTVVALRDNPDPTAAGIADVPTCVAQYGTGSQCDFAASKALHPDPIVAATKTLTSVPLIDLTGYFCTSGGTCPSVIGGVLVYRQAQHFTATFSRTLAPMLDEKLAPLVAAAVT